MPDMARRKGQSKGATAPLSYCPDFPTVRERLCSLYSRQANDRVFAVMETPSDALARFRKLYPLDYCSYPNLHERLEFWDTHLKRKQAIRDDGVPAAYLSECDQGLYGGLVRGEPRYMAHPEAGWISSMVSPILKGPLRIDGLSPDTNSTAFLRFRCQLELYCRARQGRFGISHLILADGLNFIFELVGGTRTYLALYEEPDEVRKAIDFAFDLNVLVQDAFFEQDVMLDGGTCSNFAQWLPGRIVSESVDPFHLTSVEMFEEWGREPVERIYAQYDGGILHMHANGRHLLEAVSRLTGLKALALQDDVGFPSSFSILPELRRKLGDLPLGVQCPYLEFKRALERHRLTGGVLYCVKGVPDSDDANSLMDRVRAYRC